MINFDIIHISKIDDYDEVLNILDIVFPSANHKHLISEIKNRINQKAEMILVEYHTGIMIFQVYIRIFTRRSTNPYHVNVHGFISLQIRI